MKHFLRRYEVELAFAVWSVVLFVAGICLGLYPYVTTLE